MPPLTATHRFLLFASPMIAALSLIAAWWLFNVIIEGLAGLGMMVWHRWNVTRVRRGERLSYEAADTLQVLFLVHNGGLRRAAGSIVQRVLPSRRCRTTTEPPRATIVAPSPGKDGPRGGHLPTGVGEAAGVEDPLRAL